MKLVVMLAWSAGLAWGLTLAAESDSSKSTVRINLDETPAPAGVPQPASPGKSTGTASTTPSAKAAPKKEGKAAKKKEKPAEVTGFEISRGDHGYLGVKVEDNTFKVYCYDKDRKPVVADFAAIALRWPVQYQPNQERALLTPTGDGKVLTSDKNVRPPFHFRLYVTLLKSTEAGDESGAETYVVDFAQ